MIGMVRWEEAKFMPERRRDVEGERTWVMRRRDMGVFGGVGRLENVR